jgi:hypothetical protein
VGAPPPPPPPPPPPFLYYIYWGVCWVCGWVCVCVPGLKPFRFGSTASMRGKPARFARDQDSRPNRTVVIEAASKRV